MEDFDVKVYKSSQTDEKIIIFSNRGQGLTVTLTLSHVLTVFNYPVCANNDSSLLRWSWSHDKVAANAPTCIFLLILKPVTLYFYMCSCRYRPHIFFPNTECIDLDLIYGTISYFLIFYMGNL